MKRYAIIRVDRYPICPLGFKHKCEDFVKTGICDCKHGDTKEQLVRKVAQVIMRRKLKVKIEVYKKLTLLYGDGFINKKELKELYLMCLEIAKEIIEFLGVEE